MYTDTLKVRCWHYEGSNKDIRVVVIGSKFLEPDAGFKPAVAAFHATPLTGTTPLTVQFSDDSLYNPSSWDWDFGDGSPHAYTQNPIHVYDSEGDFDVKLTVANSVGSASTTKSDYVKVHNYENLSGYTEYDPDSIFTVSTYQVAVTGYKQSYRGYVYKDYGSNYFNGIDISFECKDIPSGISAQIGLVCFANNLWQYWSSSTSDVTVSFYAPSGTAHYIRIALGGYTSRQDLAITAGNTYYCRLYRAANSATVTLYVYSDAAHNNLVGSVYTTLGSSATKWRYKFVVNSANVSDSSAFNIYIKNVSYGSGT